MKVKSLKARKSELKFPPSPGLDKVKNVDELDNLTEEDLLMIEGAREFADEALELAELSMTAYWEVLHLDIS